MLANGKLTTMMPRCCYVSWEVIYTSMIQFNVNKWAYFIACETAIISQTKISHNLNRLYEPRVHSAAQAAFSLCKVGRDEEEDEED